MKREQKSAPFQIRMQPSVKAAGERAAADQNRSLSSLMETLLIEFLRFNGYLPKGGQLGEVEVPKRQEAKKKGKP